MWWHMVEWCTHNLHRDSNSFTWHQPCNNQIALSAPIYIWIVNWKRCYKRIVTHSESYATGAQSVCSRAEHSATQKRSITITHSLIYKPGSVISYGPAAQASYVSQGVFFFFTTLDYYIDTVHTWYAAKTGVVNLGTINHSAASQAKRCTSYLSCTTAAVRMTDHCSV